MSVRKKNQPKYQIKSKQIKDHFEVFSYIPCLQGRLIPIKISNSSYFLSIVYRSNEKSVDFCPTSDINSNSTVLMTLSTSSHKPVLVHIKVLLKGKIKATSKQLSFCQKLRLYFKPDVLDLCYFKL